MHYTNTADDEFGRLVVQDKRKWVIDNGESVVYGGDLSVHSCVHCDSVQDRIQVNDIYGFFFILLTRDGGVWLVLLGHNFNC